MQTLPILAMQIAESPRSALQCCTIVNAARRNQGDRGRLMGLGHLDSKPFWLYGYIGILHPRSLPFVTLAQAVTAPFCGLVWALAGARYQADA